MADDTVPGATPATLAADEPHGEHFVRRDQEEVLLEERDRDGVVRQQHVGWVALAALGALVDAKLSFNPKVSNYPYALWPGDQREDLHRFVFTLLVGPIPPGYDVHHLDKNPLNNKIDNLVLREEKKHRVAHLRAHELEKQRFSPRKRFHLGLDWHRPRPPGAPRQIDANEAAKAIGIRKISPLVSMTKPMTDILAAVLAEMWPNLPSLVHLTFVPRQKPAGWSDVACRRSGMKTLLRPLNRADKALLGLLKALDWQLERVAGFLLDQHPVPDLDASGAAGLLGEILTRPHVQFAYEQLRKTGVVPIYNTLPPPPSAKPFSPPSTPRSPRPRRPEPAKINRKPTTTELVLSETQAFEFQRDFVQVEELIATFTATPAALLLDSGGPLPTQDPAVRLRADRLRQAARKRGVSVMVLLCKSAEVLGPKAAELSLVPRVHLVSTVSAPRQSS